MSNYAEYPRPSGPNIPYYGRGPGVYFEAIGEAWDLVRQDLGHWIAATVVLLAVTYGLSIPLTFLTQSLIPTRGSFDDMMTGLGKYYVIQMLVSIVPTALSYVLIVGMVSMGVRKARGEYINVGMIFEPFRRFGSLFLTTLLFTLVTYAALFVCCLPTFFFTPVLLLMPTVAYLQELGPIDALSVTFDACKAHWLGLLALTLVTLLLAFAGVIVCCVGVLISVPIALVTYSIHYRAFFESTPPVIQNAG